MLVVRLAVLVPAVVLGEDVEMVLVGALLVEPWSDVVGVVVHLLKLQRYCKIVSKCSSFEYFHRAQPCSHEHHCLNPRSSIYNYSHPVTSSRATRPFPAYC